VDRIATARNVEAARNNHTKVTAKAKDFVKSKDDLLTKAIANMAEMQARTSFIKSSLALRL